MRRQHVGGQEMGSKRLLVRKENRRKIVIVLSRIGDQRSHTTVVIARRRSGVAMI